MGGLRLAFYDGWTDWETACRLSLGRPSGRYGARELERISLNDVAGFRDEVLAVQIPGALRLIQHVHDAHGRDAAARPRPLELVADG